MVHDSSYVMTTELEYSSSVVMTWKVSRSGANPKVCKGGPIKISLATRRVNQSFLVTSSHIIIWRMETQVEALHS